LIEIIITLFSVVSVMSFAGYFVSKTISAGGFGYYRTNLLAFIDPSEIWSVFYSTPYRAGDYEGFAYFGAGMMLLTVLSIGIHFVKKESLPIDRQIVAPLVVLAVLLFIYAVSDRVAFGPYELFNYRFPRFTEKITTTFRVSGRFVWPVVYMIYLAVFCIFLRQVNTRTARFVLAILLLLQGVDLVKAAGVFQAGWREPYSPPLTSPFWSEAANVYGRIAFVIPTEDTPNVGPVLLFAADNRMSVNGGSMARVDPTTLAALQDELRDAISENRYRADTLYIFTNTELWNEAITKLHGGSFKGQVDGYRVIAPNWNGCTRTCGAVPASQAQR